MANIQRRTTSDGSTTFRVQVRLKGYPPQTATFKRKTDATKWAQQTEAAIREGRHFKTVEAKRHTLAELIDRYLRDVLPRKGIGTAHDQRRQLNWWKTELGHYVLADITPALIVEQRDKLLAGITAKGQQRSPATVNRYLAALGHAFTIALKEYGWIEDSPFRKLGKLKESRGRVRYLSDEERTRLLQICRESRSPDLYCAVVLALSTGARRMEALAICWKDVDLKRGFITLEETKNGERRSLPLVGHALELMQERAKVRRIDTDLVFPSPVDPSKPATFRKAWETALKTAEIEDFRFHDLRHSAASYLAMSGASLSEIAEVLGHKTLAMVKRYSHIHPEHTRGVVDRMNNKIFGSGQ